MLAGIFLYTVFRSLQKGDKCQNFHDIHVSLQPLTIALYCMWDTIIAPPSVSGTAPIIDVDP